MVENSGHGGDQVEEGLDVNNSSWIGVVDTLLYWPLFSACDKPCVLGQGLVIIRLAFDWLIYLH